MKIPLAPADPLGEALHFLRMSGVMYCRSEFTAPWALSLPALEGSLMFHVVTSVYSDASGFKASWFKNPDSNILDLEQLAGG